MNLSGAVAALAAQMLAVGEQTAGSGALHGQTRVDKSGGTTVMVHVERLKV